jgi:predicted ester cyclase
VSRSPVEELVRGFFEEAINGHDIGVFPRFCGPGYVWHPSSGSAPDIVGLEAFAGMVGGFLETFPDLEANVLDVVAGEDRAAVRYRQRVTHARMYAGMPPTGRQVSWDGVAIYRAEGGLLVEEWSVSDSLTLMLGIGAVVPAPGAQL